MNPDQVVGDGKSLNSLVDELLAKHPISGIGPLAWLESADVAAMATGTTVFEVLSLWVGLSRFDRILVEVGDSGLSISELTD